MSLSRDHLKNAAMRDLANARGDTGQPRALTDDELAASQRELMAQAPAADHVWVFGYGSLIWNPLFTYDQQELAVLHGYRRSFCMKTQLSRGTPECPGLLLGLEPGGSCKGIAFRLTGPQMQEELQLLWRREMVTGAYCPRWVSLRTGTETRRALAFVMNRQYPFYVTGLDVETTADILATAAGPIGTCAEYLLKTHEGLLARGIRDRHLESLAVRVRRRQAAAGADNAAAPAPGGALPPA